ncbi:hypothetical protein M0813_15490 [Anaeramoeba flamelloides]|uniref:Uncharacterized protein n=1 Tax=Anaeramoeba flamelloides TaxID=1746091 RepID=A0ABQ8Z1K1_9EUKA|nr:hypothetical protein M0813_15490 [Anaeramoeba flamelloides]
MSDSTFKIILQQTPVNLKRVLANEKFESSLKMSGVPVMDFFRKEETLEAVIKSLVETDFEKYTEFYEHLHKHLSSEIPPLHEILAEKDVHMATLIKSYSDRLGLKNKKLWSLFLKKHLKKQTTKKNDLDLFSNEMFNIIELLKLFINNIKLQNRKLPKDMIQIEKFIQEKCPIEPQETLEYYTVFNKCNEYELPDINDIFFNMD